MALSKYYARNLAYRLTEKVQSGEYLNANQAATEFLLNCSSEELTAIVMQLGSKGVRKLGVPVMAEALAEVLLVAAIAEHLEFGKLQRDNRC